MPLSLSPDEYREAIYIDFEGEGRSRAKELREPHMVGEFKPNQKGKGRKINRDNQ